VPAEAERLPGEALSWWRTVDGFAATPVARREVAALAHEPWNDAANRFAAAAAAPAASAPARALSACFWSNTTGILYPRVHRCVPLTDPLQRQRVVALFRLSGALFPLTHRWKALSLYPKPFSPVHNALKFSTVCEGQGGRAQCEKSSASPEPESLSK
jgi:hypothetical protein